MKKIALCLVMTIVSISMAFTQLEEGYISYSIEVSSDDPEAAMMVGLFNGSSLKMYFDDEFLRTEIDLGSMATLCTVVNSETEEVMVLQGGIMGQKGALTTLEEMGDAEEENPEVTIKFEKGTKKILNYKCKKAIVIEEDGTETTYWYTEKIKALASNPNSVISKLPGLALEYMLEDNNGMLMSFKATAVETSLDEETKLSKLNLTIPEGYEIVSYEEIGSGL